MNGGPGTGRPIVRLDAGGLTLADVRRWVADMDAAGAEDSSPAFAAVTMPPPGFPPSPLPGGIERLVGLGGLGGLGGFPRVSTGPAAPPPPDRRIARPGHRGAPRQG